MTLLEVFESLNENTKTLQDEYDRIYSFFKSDVEPFDSLKWDGESLKILVDGEITENYTRKDLIELGVFSEPI